LQRDVTKTAPSPNCSPELYGLAWADIKIPTPFGIIECFIEKEKEPKIKVPNEIEVV